jgi:hypothetical protein
VIVSHPWPTTIHLVAPTVEREIAEHVVERTVLQHQYDDVLDPLKTGGRGHRERPPRRLQHLAPM